MGTTTLFRSKAERGARRRRVPVGESAILGGRREASRVARRIGWERYAGIRPGAGVLVGNRATGLLHRGRGCGNA
jgi:hypothetical protein